MDSPRPRPLVRFETPRDPDAVVARFAEALKEPGPVVGGAAQRHVQLMIAEADRHFWSPFLSLEVVAEGEGAVVRGRFGPHPHVWTFFMFVHFAVLVGGIFIAAYGAARWMMDEPAWGLWAIPGAALLHAFVYGAEFIGKGLGSEQMFVVRDFVQGVLER